VDHLFDSLNIGDFAMMFGVTFGVICMALASGSIWNPSDEEPAPEAQDPAGQREAAARRYRKRWSEHEG